jgi:hypothetical protein
MTRVPINTCPWTIRDFGEVSAINSVIILIIVLVACIVIAAMTGIELPDIDID